MIRLQAGVMTFGLAAVAIVSISVTLQRRHLALQAAAAVPRFSGSSIVAKLPSVLPPARLQEPLSVAIVRDAAAASFYDSPGTLDSIVEAWRKELAAIGAEPRIVRANIAASVRNADVLVIPSSPCLTVATREAMENATSRGQGIVVTGLTGVYDAGCRRLGYGSLVGWTGASRVEVLDERAMVYVVLPAGTPLSADIPPGARIELNPARQIALRHRSRDAYYSDYELQPKPARKLPLLDGAVVRGTDNRARIVYWGFDLNSVLQRPWNRSIVRLLVRNSIAWAGRAPMAWVEPWPRGRRAAAAFAQDVEYNFQNVRYAADSLRAAGIPATYFLTSKNATHYKRLTRELAKVGEIASHTDGHQRLGGIPFDMQRASLRKSQRHLRRFVDRPIAGLRPPEEQFDTATMAAWLAAGGTYMFGVNDSRTAAPELLKVGHDTLLLLSRVVDDDLALTQPGRLPNARKVHDKFHHDFVQMRALGGLYLLSYHSQLLARPELVSVVTQVARMVAADSAVWISTTGGIASWWRARAALQVRTRTRANALEIVVKNRSEDYVTGAVTRLVLPDKRRVLGATAPMLKSEPGMLRFALSSIPGGESRTIRVRLEAPKVPPRIERPRPKPRSWHAPPARARKAPWWQFWKHL